MIGEYEDPNDPFTIELIDLGDGGPPVMVERRGSAASDACQAPPDCGILAVTEPPKMEEHHGH